MFGKKKNNLKKEYDERLLTDIDHAFSVWSNCKNNQQTIYEADEELIAQTKAAKAQYELVYREARIRQVKGRIQAAVISH